MQNVDQAGNEDANNENKLKTVEIDQENPTSAMTGPSVTENPQVPTSQSTFGLDVSCSDDDEVSEVDSFILDAEDPDPSIEPNFLLTQSVEASNLQTVTVDPETHARLEALLDAAGIGKLSTADGKALTDPEVLRKLTSSVSCALDEAAQALHRMRAEQQCQLGNTDSQRSLAEACSDGDVPTVRKLLREGGSVHETTEEGDSLLSLACSAGYYELAQVLLAMKANVEDRGIKGDCTPLMEAASGGYVDIVKLLIAHGADVNAQSSAGNTPLHYAACGGYEDVVQVLIDVGANVEQHNENGHTPLMEAASAGHVGVARILLNSGAGINTHSNEFKESALTLACYKGHLEMVKFLLDAGADQEHKTDEMHTALMEASMDGHVEVARLLLDSGAQVNMPADSFESPLTLAACGGHVELANLLIERGANIEEVNDEGYTPLMEAAREGHEEMVALLLAHGADINAQTEETQETALTLACCGGFLDVTDFLISAGAAIELGCSTPLMEAAQEGHLELVKYLLKCKANVQATTGTGDTALTYACENGHTDVADVLLQHGAILEHESEGGRTPLMKAARAGHLCTVQFLINKGADVNRQTTTNDHTVLSLACAGGHFAVVELLLAHGGDPTHKLKDGSTMVIEAAKGGHTQVVKLLLEYPNRMLMNTTQEQLPPQITANETAHLESRVPIHGLANIVPPSEPDVNPAKSNNLTTAVCDHSDGTGCKKKPQDKDMNIPIKAWDQNTQNTIQKPLAKKPLSTGTIHNIDPAAKTAKTSNLTTTNELSPQLNENGVISDLLHDDTIDLKAGERLEAIISNVMAKELISTPSTREEQILRKQQILEELQKVERELQEKAQQQLLITAQHQHQQHQKHQQLQQALQNSRQPLHQIIRKQLEEQKKILSISSQPLPTPTSTDLPEISFSNNLDKQVEKPAQREIIVTKPSLKPNISESNHVTVSNGGGQSTQPSPTPDKHKPNNNQEEKITNGNTSGTSVKTNGGQQSVNGGNHSHNGGSQSSQTPKLPPPPPLTPLAQSIPLPQTSAALTTGAPLSQAPPKPPQLLPTQQQQLEQQIIQLQLQQQQSVMNPQPFVLNESQRQALHNLIVRQQQEAQQLAQQTTLQFPQLQLSPQQQEHLLQVISQQQITQQQIQQAQQAVQHQQFISPAPQVNPQHPNLLQHPAEINPSFSQALFNQQQQQQLLQQQQFLQQQLQQIKPPVMVPGQKPAAPRNKKKMPPISQLDNQYNSLMGIDTVTPPPSTPLTPNPSPASDSMSALIDLDAQTESNHDTALTLACAGGHAELVTYLLTKGADIEHRDKKGFTPLILAATAGHVDVVEILLESSAEIEAQSERTKDTPLSLACSGGRYEVVELLLSRGANKEHRNVSDYTPLSLAASGGFVNIIKLLLSHGAEINSRTGSKLGISPLMLAAMNGHTAAVKLLLDMGSDINAQIETNRNTALTLACFQGRHEVVSLLVDRRANIEHRAKTGLTPLMEAASGGYVEVGRVLLDKGADVNAPPVPSSRDTALTIAADKGHYRFVELLLSRYALVVVKNKKGNSPLWLACNGGHLDVVQLLVSAPADIDSQDNRKVSCLMAAFRKGHIKVVKWMVKHVNQFPSDAELSRYIATVTDKELQKKCQQCMEIIVSAKDRQAAEANKVATSLLEELDKEKQHEENRKLAAQKKREKKKKKKKEKQGTKDKEQSDTNSKNSSPEPESEDSQVTESTRDMIEVPTVKPDLVILPPAATTTSTLGLTLPSSEPIYTKSKGRVKKPEKKMSVGELELNGPSLQDENQDPLNNRGDKQSSSVSRVESKKNKRNQREREKNVTPEIDGGVVDTSNISTSVTNKGSNNKTKSLPSNKKKKEKNSQINSSTAIGDLDDFGNLPIMAERDFEKLSKKPEKSKSSGGDKHHVEKVPSEPSNPNMLSVKSTTAVANSPKRGQKKEEGWKEVIRKSKKVQVPASAISRVIGRGGCNINAIREVSGANIEVEKNRGSGERTITIKGSAEVTRQAHALITALVTDPDKELVEILPKTKTKQPVENKSLYFIPPNDKPSSNTSNTQSNNNTQQKSNKTLAPRLQQQQATLSSPSNRPPGTAQNPPNPGMVWGNSPAPGAISPSRNTVKAGAPYTVNITRINGPMMADKSGVTRQLFMGERRGFGSPTSATTVARSSLSTVTKTSPASPSFNMRPDVRLQQPVMRNPNPKTLVPGTVKLLQRPNSANPRFDGQPLPIVPNQTASTATTQTVTSSSGGMNLSSSGEFSPFNNPFSNAAEQLLGKKEDGNERMNFASVAAAGVVPPYTGNNVVSPVPHSPDPALQAKAPGFKPMTSGPRMANPQDVIAGFKGPAGPGYPMMPQIVDMNTMQASIQAWQGYQGMYPMQGFNTQQNNYSNQSPNLSPRSSQSGSTSLSPRSSNAGFDPSQKEEYTTPNQPMTLPKISSSLNPNAPDFTSRSVNTGPGDPQNFFQGNQAGHEMTKQLHAVFSSLGANQAPGGPLTPDGSNQDPLSGMSSNQFEFIMSSLMQQVALQNQQPSSPGLGQPPGPGFTPPPMVPRAFSPLTVQGRPSSAPSVAGLIPRDGASPTPIGPGQANSPLPPSTPPMPEMMRVEDRRQLRPIGGERVHKKAPGPPLPNNDVPDYNDSFWNLTPQLNMDWNQKVGTSVGMTPATLQTSVISTSVNLGGNMSTDLSSNREMRLDNPGHSRLDNPGHSRPNMDDLNDTGFSHYTQNSPLTPMPLFNGVGGPYPNSGFSTSGIGSGGDGIQSMWSAPIEPSATDDGPDTGVDVSMKNKVNEMWNWAK